MQSSDLDKLISSFEKAVDSAVAFETKWDHIWDQIKTIGSSFKKTRYPTGALKQEAWDHFQSLVQKVKEIQSEERYQRKEFALESERHKNKILDYAELATPPSELAKAISSIFTFPIDLVADAVDTLLPGPELDETRRMLENCSENLKSGWKTLSKNKNKMIGHHKQESFEALKEAQRLLDDAWENWKSSKTAAHKARQEQYHEKRKAFEKRVGERIDNLESRLVRLHSVLDHKKSHLSELRDKRDSARSDDFLSVVEGWIDQEETAIQEIQEKIGNIERWLSEERSKL